MNRMLAIVERELRKFFRSPALMLTAMIFPLVQLVILGNAFGGKITQARLGVVDYDHGPQALRVHEAFDAVVANLRTFRPIPYASDKQAQLDVRSGKLDAAVVIPPQFSRRVLAGENPSLGLVVDNSDQFVSSSLEQELQSLTDALNQPQVPQRVVNGIALKIVEIYPYIDYLKFLLPGSISLAMFVSVMIGGGMLYIDDKARGVHEGFLVTPITKLELVGGLVLSGALKAILAGAVLTVLGSLVAGLGVVFHPMALLQLACMITATSLAFNAMMFLMMVRVEDPLVPRAMFGILNTLLYFPSGAVYPVEAFPGWLRAMATVDPFTYAVHGFKSVLLKDAGWAALLPDLAYLLAIGAVAQILATRLFKRTL
jgi:ABC-2 type transport system permease protein